MRGVHIKPVLNPLANGMLLAAEGSSACYPSCVLCFAGERFHVPAEQESMATVSAVLAQIGKFHPY